MNKTILSLSGGMDSATLLGWLKEHNHTVKAISFLYGSKHNKYELTAAQNLANYYNVDWQVLDLRTIFNNIQSNLMQQGGEIPEGHYNDATMSQTVVPGRNHIFAAILAGIAESMQYNYIALGVHQGDHCLPGSVKIMTPKGFVPIKELAEGDTIFSSCNGKIETDIILKIWEKGNPDSILEIKTGKDSEPLRCTSEHKIYAIRNKGRTKNREFQRELIKVPAKELAEGDFLIQPISFDSRFRSGKISEWIKFALRTKYPHFQLIEKENKINLQVKFNRQLTPVDISDEERIIEILAWYICEGWTPTHKSAHNSNFLSGIAQKYNKNALQTETIYDCLAKIIEKPRYNITDSGTGDEWSFNISGTLSALLQLCGKRSSEKHIPQELFEILVFDERLRGIFLTVCMEADGHKLRLGYRGEIYMFASTSEQLINQIRVLGQLHGAKVIRLRAYGKTQYIQISFPATKSRLCKAFGHWLLPITSIKEVSNEETVWDMEIEKNHNFLAEGYLVSNSIYPDCRPKFINKLDLSIRLQSENTVSILAPFLGMNKTDILALGHSFEIPVPYQLTRTCYKDQELSCGKCGSCNERLEAWNLIGKKDPINYD